MALDAEQLKEITDGLGIPEGGTLVKTITDIFNTNLNSYDKRKTGELEKLLEGVKLPEGFAEQFAAAVEKMEKDPEADPDDKKQDVSKLPEWARTMFEGLEKANKTLQTQFADEKTAREARDVELEEEKKTAAQRAMYDAAVAAATSKDGGGLDPARMGLLLPYLKDQDLIREVEGKPGTYQMNTGELDPIHNDPVYKPLNEAMQKFAATDTGKTFRPVVRAPGTPGPGGDEPIVKQGDLRTVASFGGDMAALREAADKGLVDFGQGS
jgi:hypothetical protein